MPPVPVIFDLDGTLVDSAPDIAAAVNAMLDEAGAAALPFATVRGFIGNGAPKLVERAIAATGLAASSHAALLERFLAHYAAHPADATRPYPEVPETLKALRAAGHPLAICTNKPAGPAVQVLRAIGLGPFDQVVGGDTLPVRKPDPAPLRHVLSELNTETAIFVGDSEVDAATAQAAGVPFFLFTEGYRKRPVAEIPHSAAFTQFDDLPGLVAELSA